MNGLHELVSVEVHVWVLCLEVVRNLGGVKLLAGQVVRDEVLQLLSVRIQVRKELAGPCIVVIVVHLTCGDLELLADISPQPAALLHVEFL